VLKEAGAQPLELDLDGPDEVVQRAAQDAIRVYDHIDVLVNNAGSNVFAYGPVEEVKYVFGLSTGTFLHKSNLTSNTLAA
jgi:NAD(P)-dependent dehydrogenase (short-subunit alcohol dehydrogenase family)